eukprot:SAG11_NODE_34207_length_273_cov_0.683908_1_plen_46_part_01
MILFALLSDELPFTSQGAEALAKETALGVQFRSPLWEEKISLDARG